MHEDIKSGICLWDDTQSMSYLNINDMTWFNQNLIDAMVEAAGQTSRKNVTVTIISVDGESSEYTVSKGSTLRDLVKSVLIDNADDPNYEDYEADLEYFKQHMSVKNGKTILEFEDGCVEIDFGLDDSINEDLTITCTFIENDAQSGNALSENSAS